LQRKKGQMRTLSKVNDEHTGRAPAAGLSLSRQPKLRGFF
jgi:hypothetical protein